MRTMRAQRQTVSRRQSVGVAASGSSHGHPPSATRGWRPGQREREIWQREPSMSGAYYDDDEDE